MPSGRSCLVRGFCLRSTGISYPSHLDSGYFCEPLALDNLVWGRLLGEMGYVCVVFGALEVEYLFGWAVVQSYTVAELHIQVHFLDGGDVVVALTLHLLRHLHRQRRLPIFGTGDSARRDGRVMVET